MSCSGARIVHGRPPLAQPNASLGGGSSRQIGVRNVQTDFVNVRWHVDPLETVVEAVTVAASRARRRDVGAA